ncbi:hypothetical protein [Rhodopseudomonas pseudopalustris]|uniref:Uncharacterized protein n=1 Tax=Rhodopseudomonas pseudopalustris TaxID=1513892 RepID=A0A1H8WHL9_9BRAD|nr:hypothetical protein [Rhodopseudomonas pseudopalustris]SEP27132.1 hypothetical protein SAMN05444123_112101 [Rhodopseudomonas pseudopalustris]
MTIIHGLYVAALSAGASIALLLFVIRVQIAGLRNAGAYGYALAGVLGLILLAFTA